MGETLHKYDRIVQYIQTMIEENQLRPGERIPSENELVRQFGMSRCTVRRAIELLAVRGVVEKRHGSGTFVCGFPPRGRTHTVGIVTTYLDDYIFPSLVNAIENVLASRHYSLTLGITGNQVEKERVCLQSMLDHDVDGVILEGTKSALPNPNLDLLQKFAERHVPVLFINSRYDTCDGSYVMMDDELAGHMAGEYLIRCGHRRIAGLFKSDDRQGHKRYQGFLRSLHEHRLQLDENALVWYTTEDLPGLFSGESDQMLRQRFAHSTAVVCYNDQIALQLIHLLARAHLHAPEDLSVIGFDDSDLCRVASVKLTSVSHAHEEMGVLAAEGLLSLIEGGKPVRKLLTPRLVVRDSVRVIAR